MASKKTRKPKRVAKRLTRTLVKKQLPQHNNSNTTKTLYHTSTSSIVSTCSSSSSSSTTSFSPKDTKESVPSAVLTSPGGGFCTPKAQKSRIPEILTCPPAPKKQRVTQNSVLRRRQIVFFAPPEIELFFVNAHGR